LRQDVIEQHGDIANNAWTEPGNLVASGPFRLAEWDHGTRIVLENNPNFWNEDMMPTLTRIELSIIEDENTGYAAYQAGDLDMAPAPISSLRSLTESEGAYGELHRVAEVSNFAFVFNMAQPPFDDVEARKAFCRAIDRGTAVSEIRQGSGTPTESWLPPSLFPYYDETRGDDLVFNPGAAQSSLNAALAVASANSGSASFPDVSITYADTGSNGTLMEYLQGQWQANLDVDVALEGLDPPTFGQTFFSGQFDLGYVGFGQDYHHPENWLLLWTETGALNAGGYANPAFTASVEAALAEDDFDEAVVLWQRAEEILIDEDVVLCALFNSEATWLIDSNVEGLVMTGADAIPGDAFFWDIAIIKSS
jgi:ABC-type oligopeptide transport system substrate-binding subunit